jgi:hypothetical protein
VLVGVGQGRTTDEAGVMLVEERALTSGVLLTERRIGDWR